MIKNSILLLATCLVILSSCEKDPVVPNEEELITTVNYTLTPSGGGTPVVLTFQDLDGDGGNDPIISGGVLQMNTSYNGMLSLLNETETPAENISEEVEEEAEEHQFFFESGIMDLTIAYNDADADGNPIGLSSILTTGMASSDSVTITLRHEPNKFAAGVSTGDINAAGGETDIEVTFPVDVQ